MGRPISQQLVLFLQSVLLGGGLGLVYDLLRALRSVGGRIWGGVLDVLFCLTASASLFFFVMAGDGEMRIFIVLGAGGGMLLFLCLAGPLLRPVWRFWLDVALFPARLVKKFLTKCEKKAKKLFSFCRTGGIMAYNHLRRRSAKEVEKDETDAASG